MSLAVWLIVLTLVIKLFFGGVVSFSSVLLHNKPIFLCFFIPWFVIGIIPQIVPPNSCRFLRSIFPHNSPFCYSNIYKFGLYLGKLKPKSLNLGKWRSIYDSNMLFVCVHSYIYICNFLWPCRLWVTLNATHTRDDIKKITTVLSRCVNFQEICIHGSNGCARL